MMNVAYLVDNAALLSLQEKQDGVEFHCFDMDSKVQIAEGHIGWDMLDKQPFSKMCIRDSIPCGHLCRQRDDDPLWLTNFLCFH